MPPAPEHHERHDQPDRRDGHGPSHGHTVHSVENVGEPIAAQARDLPKDCRVDSVGDSEGPVGVQCDDSPDQECGRRHDPTHAAEADAARQRRRRARRTPSAWRSALVAGAFVVTRSLLTSTSAPRRLASVDASAASAPFSARSDCVVRRSETALTTSTSGAPDRATTERRTSGVTFSAGWSPRSSASSTRSSIAGSVLKRTATSITP